MKIIQQNISKKNENVEIMMCNILNENPDVIFFSEFCYDNHKYSIIEKLEENGYGIHYPDKFQENYTAACVLAVKNYEFVKKKRESIIQTSRYMEGTIYSTNEEASFYIECFFAYVQQCFNDNQSEDLLAKKKNMLSAIKAFVEENEGKIYFIGGDLNTNINNPNAKALCEFKKIYNNHEIEDTYNKPTWGNEHLDYALISKALKNEYHYDTKPINTTSDHLGLCTEIFKEEFICTKCGKTYPINGCSIPDMCDECRNG